MLPKTLLVLFTSESNLLKLLKNWKDEFLTWNPDDYDNITIMKVLYSKIWKPGKYFFSKTFKECLYYWELFIL